LVGHTDAIEALTITADGNRIISGSHDTTIKIWNLAIGKEDFTLNGHTYRITALAVTPDSKRVISGSYDTTIKVWDLETGKEEFTLTNHKNSINTIKVTPNGKRFISVADDDMLKLWDLSKGEEIASFAGESALRCCAITPDGTTIIAGEESGQVHFLQLEETNTPRC
jgi:WD40 repeat protein